MTRPHSDTYESDGFDYARRSFKWYVGYVVVAIAFGFIGLNVDGHFRVAFLVASLAVGVITLWSVLVMTWLIAVNRRIERVAKRHRTPSGS